MRNSRVVPMVLLMFAAIACSDGSAETSDGSVVPATLDPATRAEPSTTTAAPTTTLAPTTTTTQPEREGIEGLEFDYLDPSSFPTLEVVDPGSEPREVRVWTPPVGTVVAMTTTLTSESTQSSGDTTLASDFTATIGATVEIVARTDEGFVARTVFDTATVSSSDPSTEAVLESIYAELIGVAVHQLTRPDGTIIAQAGIEALGQGDVLGNGLGGIAVPLPSEPIGAGAVWRTNQVIGVEGIRIGQNVTTRIVDIQGSLLTIEIEAASAFDPDSGAEELGPITLQGSSTGTAVWDLSIGMPVSASSRSVQDVESTDPATPFAVRTVTTIEISTAVVD